ncbi:MAG: ParB/RepB/Spo0J family partition protein [Alphaproteobacteria bacterium]|nr:ParB/RepB/Spo0J family partition protein [Alphaproteobacteria bacterium]
MAEARGLGRGLNALFEDTETDEIFSSVEMEIQQAPAAETRRNMVGVEQLSPGRFQPRKIFKEETLDELASSIREHGVLQPLLVRALDKIAGKGDEYEIIAGERRWRAAQRAQVHEVPVIVLDLEDLQAFKIALIENLQREDLDPIDEALGYQRLLDEYKQTQDELAKAVGKSRSHITNMVRLLNLPSKVQGYVSAGELSMGHARALINTEKPEELAQQVISQGLSVRQTEKLAAEAQGRTQKTRTGSGAEASLSPGSSAAGTVTVQTTTHKLPKDADTLALENDMSNALGMRVSIETSDGKSGNLTINFKSLDQLDELLHRLAHYPGSHLNG